MLSLSLLHKHIIRICKINNGNYTYFTLDIVRSTVYTCISLSLFFSPSFHSLIMSEKTESEGTWLFFFCDIQSTAETNIGIFFHCLVFECMKNVYSNTRSNIHFSKYKLTCYLNLDIPTCIISWWLHYIQYTCDLWV